MEIYQTAAFLSAKQKKVTANDILSQIAKKFGQKNNGNV
jgi:hypothetical protein